MEPAALGELRQIRLDVSRLLDLVSLVASQQERCLANFASEPEAYFTQFNADRRHGEKARHEDDDVSIIPIPPPCRPSTAADVLRSMNSGLSPSCETPTSSPGRWRPPRWSPRFGDHPQPEIFNDFTPDSPVAARIGVPDSPVETDARVIERKRLERDNSDNSPSSPATHTTQGLMRKSSRLLTAATKSFTEMTEYDGAANYASQSGLPGTWPACLRMRTELSTQEDDTRPCAATARASRTWDKVLQRHRRAPQTLFASAANDSYSSILKAALRVWSPHSPAVLALDVAGTLVLMHDLLVTPFVVAWDIPFGGAFDALAFTSASYWTLQILANFKTGFYSKGELRMGAGEVARNYLATRFLLDAVLVASDWINIALDGVGASSLLRVLKVARLAKVLRLVSSMTMLDKIMTRNIGTARRAFTLLKVAAFTIFFTHWMGCAWYALGSYAPANTGRRWPMQLVDGDVDSMDMAELNHKVGVLYTYLTSYHWALAQLTNAAVEINASNNWERVACITLTVCGVLFNSIIISVISMEATEWVTVRRSQMDSMVTLNRFLAQVAVDAELATRVRRQAAERIMSDSQPLSEENVGALMMISSDLRVELARRTRVAHLLKHPLFCLWSDISLRTLHALCDEAIRFKALAAEDVAFMPGIPAKEALIVTRGQLIYFQDPNSSPVTLLSSTRVSDGAWLSEAALWSQWVHVGKLSACTGSTLLEVSTAGLLRVMQQNDAICQLTCTYGRAYHVRITAAVPPYSEWPSDLKVPNTDASDLLSTDVSLGLLGVARSQGLLHGITQEAFRQLREEIRNEECALIKAENDEIHRVLFVCALHLEREANGQKQILMHIGRWSGERGEEISPIGLLPGTKRTRGELPRGALMRLLSDLAPLQEGIRVFRSEETLEVRESERLCIKTRYVRTVNYATLVQDFTLQGVEYLRAERRDQARFVRPPSSRSVTSMQPGASFIQLDECLEQEVFAIHAGQAMQLYAWLPPDLFEALAATAGREVLKAWLACLGLDKTPADEFWIEENTRSTI